MDTTCTCMTWARTFEETQGGKYPPSQHHPNCPAYKTSEWAVVSVDGVGCVMHPDEVEDFIAGEDSEGYVVTRIQLTDDQIANMREFEGF